jgi:hypothetical protein
MIASPPWLKKNIFLGADIDAERYNYKSFHPGEAGTQTKRLKESIELSYLINGPADAFCIHRVPEQVSRSCPSPCQRGKKSV